MTPTARVCPECQQGKCVNCDGTAWDPDRDEVSTCEHTHPAPTTSLPTTADLIRTTYRLSASAPIPAWAWAAWAARHPRPDEDPLPQAEEPVRFPWEGRTG